MKYGKDASKSIHLVCSTEFPLQQLVGEEVGKFIQDEHTANGVKVHNQAKVAKVNTDWHGNLVSVTLTNRKTIPADLVIFGTGVTPATSFLTNSDIKLNEDGSIVCNPFLQTSVKGIYAAGDVANYPYWPTGGRTRQEHWATSLDQGSHAAFNMLSKYVPYGQIPFFWSSHY